MYHNLYIVSHFFNLSILVQFLIESSTQLVQRISILKKKIANFQHRHSNEHGGIHLLNAIDPPVSSNRRKIDVSKQKKKKKKEEKGENSVATSYETNRAYPIVQWPLLSRGITPYGAAFSGVSI